ncbi:MAG: hypothetical protein WBN51_05660 [Gammaproteobacteria bacterium]
MFWQKTLHTLKRYAFPRTTVLERELADVRAGHQAVAAELASARDEFAQVRTRDAHQIDTLQRQLAAIESERSVAREQVELLEASLEAASRRQEITEEQLRSLESKLEAERTLYESSQHITGEALNRLQAEQRNLNARLSVQATSFNEFGKQLLESSQEESTRTRQPVLSLAAIAGLLFLLSALLVIVTIHDSGGRQREQTDVAQGIREMQLSMERHFNNQQDLLVRLTAILERKTTQVIDPDTAPTGHKGRQDAPGPAAPASDPEATVDKPVRKPEQRMSHDRRGPPLLMEVSTPVSAAGKPEFDPDLKDQQHDLLALGFDLGQTRADGFKGVQTRQALEEFELLFLPVADPGNASSGQQLGSVLKHFATRAREDARKFSIDSGVLAAIRLSTLRTGVDFSFLMELAATESSFDPASMAATSSAAGLYQFRKETWLDAVRNHGDKYGIGNYAAQVEHIVTRNGKTRPVIRDAAVRQHVLDLRFNPRIAALLAAEHVKRNTKRLLRRLGRVPGRTDLYLTHFFGSSGALSFLKTLAEDPDKVAHDIFPGAAKRNLGIFHTRQSKPRTVAEIYELFSRKFNTSRYEDRAPG